MTLGCDETGLFFETLLSTGSIFGRRDPNFTFILNKNRNGCDLPMTFFSVISDDHRHWQCKLQ